MGILAALFLVVASSCGLLVASALSLYLYHTFPDTWWTEVVKIQVLGGASVALFARELRNNVRLMSKPRYYETDPVNVSLLPNPLPQELTRFYGRLYAFSIYLDRYSTTAEDVAIKGDLPRTNINRLDYLFNSRHSQKSQSLA